MKLRSLLLGAALLAVAATTGQSASTGLDWIDNNTNLTFHGDLRLRYENDSDSVTAAGVPRADRNRGRIRARLGFDYKLADEWTLGARVRAGSSRSQQSPHLTFTGDDGLRDDLDFVVDRHYLQFKREGLTAWGGRNTSPFWYQNELFWDEDVTPTGLAANYTWKAGEGTLSAIGGAFYLPAGGYDLNGQLIAGQFKYSRPIDKSTLTAAAGLHFMNGREGATNLRFRNGARDYLIGVASAQWSIPIKNKPLTLGADLFHNFEDYNAAEVAPFPVASANETLGYVLSATLGSLRNKNEWLVGYYYSHIETFAVNASYAQDDWVRFGNGAQTDSSDIKGHEFRLAYAISKNINLVARLYLVEAITTVQDGNRFRLDLNWRF
jgi:hypothetical protein